LGVIKKKNSARLLWNTKPRYVVNPKNIKFQTAEVVLPNQARDQRLIQSLFNVLSNIRIERNRMNRLIWGNNLLTMQALLASGYEGKVGLIISTHRFGRI
jgi:adenine-specific DNA-methyltransferase